MKSKLLISYEIFVNKRPDMEIHTKASIESCINSAYVLLDGECAGLISKVIDFNFDNKGLIVDRDKQDILYRNDFELGQLQEAIVFQVQYVLNMGNDFTVGGGSFSIGNVNSSFNRPENRELIAPGVYKLLSNARVYNLNAFGSFNENKKCNIPLSTSKEIMERVKNEFVAIDQPQAQVGNVAYVNENNKVSFGSPQDLKITTYNTLKIAGPEGYRNSFYEIDKVPNIAFFGKDMNGTFSAVHRDEVLELIANNNQNGGNVDLSNYFTKEHFANAFGDYQFLTPIKSYTQDDGAKIINFPIWDVNNKQGAGGDHLCGIYNKRTENEAKPNLEFTTYNYEYINSLEDSIKQSINETNNNLSNYQQIANAFDKELKYALFKKETILAKGNTTFWFWYAENDGTVKGGVTLQIWNEKKINESIEGTYTTHYINKLQDGLISKINDNKNIINDLIQQLKDSNIINYVGEYQRGTTYKLGQVVSYQNKMYLVKVNTTTNEPTNKSDYDLLSAPEIDLSNYYNKQQIDQAQQAQDNLINTNQKEIEANKLIVDDLLVKQSEQNTQIEQNTNSLNSIINNYVKLNSNQPQFINSIIQFNKEVKFKGSQIQFNDANQWTYISNLTLTKPSGGYGYWDLVANDNAITIGLNNNTYKPQNDLDLANVKYVKDYVAQNGGSVDTSNFVLKNDLTNGTLNLNVNSIRTNKPLVFKMWNSGTKWGTNDWNLFASEISPIYDRNGNQLDPNSSSVFSDNLGGLNGFSRSYQCKQDLYKKIEQ